MGVGVEYSIVRVLLCEEGGGMQQESTSLLLTVAELPFLEEPAAHERGGTLVP